MDTSFFTSINAFITRYKLIQPNATIIVGLSGGPDSVFLLHYLTHIAPSFGLSIIAAHLDHQWRESSADDARFCETLCTKLGIPLELQRMSALGQVGKYNGSKEEMARKARRIFFEQLAEKYKASAIALAHHAQDQQETFFIRLLRGTSLAGIGGMKPKDGLYIRPLLATNKADILNYLDAHALTYCIDETNTSPAFLRNRIRQEVIPALKSVDDRFEATFAKTVERLHATEEYLHEHTQEVYAKLCSGNDNALDYAALLKLNPIMQHRIIVYWLCQNKVKFPVSQSFLDELIRFFEHSQAKTHAVHEQWQVVKNKNFASIAAK